MENTKNFSFKITLLKAIIIVVISFIVFGLIPFLVYGFPESSNEFGDTFGALNTLFSALAFSFLIVTAIMQRQELMMQRREIEQTNRELAKSAEAQEQSQEALNSQVRIMAKQAMLSSYQSLFQIHLDDSQNMRNPISTKSGAEKKAKEYLQLILNLVDELEEEQYLFNNPERIAKIREAKVSEFFNTMKDD